MTHQAQIPVPVSRWMHTAGIDHDEHPIIVQTYVPGVGWRSERGYRKRVSASWVRKIARAEGVTHVAVAPPNQPRRVADFSVRELLR